MTVQASAAAKQSKAAADLASIGSNATLSFYSGAQPAGPDTAATGTLLATLTWSGAAGSASGGVLTFTPPPSNAATASGTAGYARIFTSGSAGVFDFLVTATGGGGDIILPTTSIAAGVTVGITSMSMTEN